MASISTYPIIYTLYYLSTIIQVSWSQTSSTTTTTTTSGTEEENFFVATATEIIILVCVIIGCPICIWLFRMYQKRKTEKFRKERMDRLNKMLEKAEKRRHIQMARLSQHHQMQFNRVQSASKTPSLSSMKHPHGAGASHSSINNHGTFRESVFQSAATPIHSTMNAPLVELNDEPSGTPPSANKQQSISLLQHSQKKRKSAEPRKYSQSITLLKKKSNGVFSSKGVPPPPSEPQPPPPAGPPPKDAKRRTSKATRNKSHTTIAKQSKDKKKEVKFMKVGSVPPNIGGKMNMESALELPDVDSDVEVAPPAPSPKQKKFDALTGAPLQEIEDQFKMNRDRIKTEDLETSISIIQDEEEELTVVEKKDDNGGGDMSDSSSGEPLDAQDANLLQIAHQQMASKPPPSLQTIFGRKVGNEENSESEDSLMKKQAAFEQNGDLDEVGTLPDNKSQLAFDV